MSVSDAGEGVRQPDTRKSYRPPSILTKQVLVPNLYSCTNEGSPGDCLRAPRQPPILGA